MKACYKSIMLLTLMITFMFMLAGCGADSSTNESNAAGKEGSEEEKSKDSEQVKLIVGTDTSFVPFEFLNSDTGKYEGFDIELWEAIANELDLEYDLRPMDFNGLIPGLQSGNLDVALAGMTIKDERKEKVDFAIPYYDAGLLILVLSENNDIKSVDDLKGKVVATKSGTTSFDYANSLKDVKEVRPFPNIDGAYMELLNKGVDAVIFDSPNILYFAKTNGNGKVKSVGDILEGQQYGIAFPKGSDLVTKVNQVLETFMNNGTYDSIYEKWFGEKPSQRSGK